MSVRSIARKRKGAAAGATVDGEVKRLPAPAAPAPAPETERNDAEVSTRVEPLTSHADGRDEARAAFIKDAGGVPPEAPAAPASTPAASPGEPAATATTAPAMTVKDVTKQAVALLSVAGSMVGPMTVGGSPKTWALEEGEAAAIETAARPVVAKYMTSEMTPEAMLIAALAFVYLPKALAGTIEKAHALRAARMRANETRTAEGPVAPAAAPAPAPEPPRVKAAPEPVKSPQSVEAFLSRIVANG